MNPIKTIEDLKKIYPGQKLYYTSNYKQCYEKVEVTSVTRHSDGIIVIAINGGGEGLISLTGEPDSKVEQYGCRVGGLFFADKGKAEKCHTENQLIAKKLQIQELTDNLNKANIEHDKLMYVLSRRDIKENQEVNKC